MLFGIATTLIEFLYKLLTLPLPLPIISFVIADIYLTFHTVSKRNQPKTDSIQSERHLQVCILFHLFAVVLHDSVVSAITVISFWLVFVYGCNIPNTSWRLVFKLFNYICCSGCLH